MVRLAKSRQTQDANSIFANANFGTQSRVFAIASEKLQRSKVEKCVLRLRDANSKITEFATMSRKVEKTPTLRETHANYITT